MRPQTETAFRDPIPATPCRTSCQHHRWHDCERWRGLHTETLLALLLPIHTALGSCILSLSDAEDAPDLRNAPRATASPRRSCGRFQGLARHISFYTSATSDVAEGASLSLTALRHQHLPLILGTPRRRDESTFFMDVFCACGNASLFQLAWQFWWE